MYLIRYHKNIMLKCYFRNLLKFFLFPYSSDGIMRGTEDINSDIVVSNELFK